MSTTFRILLIGLFLGTQVQAIEKRSRSEGVPGIYASNTMGTGNIWFGVHSQLYLQTTEFPGSGPGAKPKIVRDFKYAPGIQSGIGLTGFSQLEVNSVPFDGAKIGLTIASLKLTYPSEDNLRLFGFGGKINVALSTEENSYTALQETPAFDPFLTFAAIADFDLIKIRPSFPSKIYLNYGNYDNYRFYNTHSQHHVGTAFEYKGREASYYLKGSVAVYREKKTNQNPNPREEFLDPIYNIGMGIKQRFTGRVPFVLHADLCFDPVSPLEFLDSELHKPIQIEVGISVPVFFKETNTEALRSLIFAEQERLKSKDKVAVGSLKKRSSAELTLNRLLLENYERDLLDDEVLNDVFNREVDAEKIKRHQKIKAAIKESMEAEP